MPTIEICTLEGCAAEVRFLEWLPLPSTASRDRARKFLAAEHGVTIGWSLLEAATWVDMDIHHQRCTDRTNEATRFLLGTLLETVESSTALGTKQVDISEDQYRWMVTLIVADAWGIDLRQSMERLGGRHELAELVQALEALSPAQREPALRHLQQVRQLALEA